MVKVLKKDQLHPVDEENKRIADGAVEYSCSVFRPGFKIVSYRVKTPLNQTLKFGQSLVDTGVRSVLIYGLNKDNRGTLVATVDSSSKIKIIEHKPKKCCLKLKSDISI